MSLGLREIFILLKPYKYMFQDLPLYLEWTYGPILGCRGLKREKTKREKFLIGSSFRKDMILVSLYKRKIWFSPYRCFVNFGQSIHLSVRTSRMKYEKG